jgi:hypothetical protein
VAKLEEADLTLLSEGLLLVAEILTFQQAKEKVDAKSANQGIIVEVQMQILDRRCHRLLSSRLYPLGMRTDRCVIRWRCGGGCTES